MRCWPARHSCVGAPAYAFDLVLKGSDRVYTFSPTSAERNDWLLLLASAVPTRALAGPLAHFRDTEVVLHLMKEAGSQPSAITPVGPIERLGLRLLSAWPMWGAGEATSKKRQEPQLKDMSLLSPRHPWLSKARGEAAAIEEAVGMVDAEVLRAGAEMQGAGAVVAMAKELVGLVVEEATAAAAVAAEIEAVAEETARVAVAKGVVDTVLAAAEAAAGETGTHLWPRSDVSLSACHALRHYRVIWLSPVT